MKIVTPGKCTNCGEPIKDNGLFLCKKCRLINTINNCLYRYTGMGDEHAICSLCCEPCVEVVNKGKCKTLKELFAESEENK